VRGAGAMDGGMNAIETNESLLERQWHQYAAAHHDRVNLVVHAITTPVFMLGTLALAGFAVRPFVGLAGVAAMLLVVAIQGATHRLEREAPPPFDGVVDVLLRLLAEQWITFPRFVLSGGFVRALRG
jgi:uncharacterized membrane protein YGL010W